MSSSGRGKSHRPLSHITDAFSRIYPFTIAISLCEDGSSVFGPQISIQPKFPPHHKGLIARRNFVLPAARVLSMNRSVSSAKTPNTSYNL